MEPQPSPQPWGKYAKPDSADAGQGQRLSLVAHCIDVAAVTRALLELPTWSRRLQRLAQRDSAPFAPAELDRLTVLAFLHDVGKAGAGFYAKALDDAARARWLRSVHGDTSQTGHTRVVAPLIGHDPAFSAHRAALGIDAILGWAGPGDLDREAMTDLWLAAVSHHGEPISAQSLHGQTAYGPTWTVPVDGYVPLAGLQRLGEAARAVWPQAHDPGMPPWRPPQAFIHAFAGLVSLADWIGSEARPEAFPLGRHGDDQALWHDALPRARRWLRHLRIDVEDLRRDLRARAPDFESVFGFAASAAQRQTAAAPLASPLLLEAETGSGKTEAALWRFKTLFEDGDVDALCFLLPTRVAATGIHARCEQFIRRLFPTSAGTQPALNTVLGVPGDLRANGQTGQRLPGFQVLWSDAGLPSPLFWAAEHSKRYFAAAVAVATVDQCLLSAMRTRHAHLRATVLLRSLLVVDEVHASDPYMRTLLLQAMQRHVAAGGHALLMSATLTSDLRAEFLAAPQTQPGPPWKRARPAATLATDANSAGPTRDYPLLSAPGWRTVLPEPARNKPVQRRVLPWMREHDRVAALAAEAIAQGARVLVLRNTVRAAVATQQALEAVLGADHPALFRCGGVVALHHGRYALPDRRALDAEVGRCFGVDAAASRTPVVLCATQTVEISVDCDADFLITDLAPMDVLLQRLGRLHRHAKRSDGGHRPDAFAAPQCVVLTPPQRDLSALVQRGARRGLGLGPDSAYPDLVCLEATLRALEDDARWPVLDIPRDNRALVEGSCGRAALDALAVGLGPQWHEHAQQIQGLRSAQAGHAQFPTDRLVVALA